MKEWNSLCNLFVLQKNDEHKILVSTYIFANVALTAGDVVSFKTVVNYIHTNVLLM